jgi:hypothetical protein
MPDTQYLFDEDRGDAALRYVLDESADNVVFMAHLGDLTQNGGGREWLLLALDWRPSAGGLVWADDAGQAQFSTFGEHVWSELVDGNDQIFLTLNGHYWPTGRVARKNAAGHDVHVHIANYQDHLSEMQRVEVERSGAADYFSLEIDFAGRFKAFAPVPVPPARPAKRMPVPGTVAYWRFEGGQDGAVVPDERRRPRPDRARQRATIRRSRRPHSPFRTVGSASSCSGRSELRGAAG